MPHVGGPVLTGIPNVLVNGKPVAVVGSRAQCNCGVDTIVSGDPRLLINGIPVAVQGSLTAHGGQVVEASGNVGTGGSVQIPNAEALKAEWEAALAELGDDHPAADAIRQCLSYLGPKPESLIDYPPVAMMEAGLPIPKSIEIRFLGLYDIVPAISNWPEGDFTAHNEDNDPVRLHVRPEHIGYAVQFCAADEFRYNFSLTSLRNADGGLAPNCREYVLPGSHADIGGGYHHDDIDRVLLMPDAEVTLTGSERVEDTQEWLSREKLMDTLVEAGWAAYKHLSLTATEDPGTAVTYLRIETITRADGLRVESQIPRQMRNVRIRLTMARILWADYARVLLYLMHEVAQIRGVPFLELEKPSVMTDPDRPDDRPYGDPIKMYGTRLSGPMAIMWGQLRNMIRNGDPCPLSEDQLRRLRKSWLHYSADWSTVGGIIAPDKPANGRRAVYANA